MANQPTTIVPEISVAEFVNASTPEFAPEVLAGQRSLETRKLSSERIQKLGLALTGFTDYLRKGRLKVIGKSEVSYLSHLTDREQAAALDKLDPEVMSCILITKSLPVPTAVVAFSKRHDIPLLRTKLVSSQAISHVSILLQERLAPQITVHGVLMGMYGTGVLMFGDSGIGKSECALDLISRGHRLISDDSVLVKRVADRLVGESPELTRGHLEIRGLGIIGISELFGVSAVGEKCSIELCIELKEWGTVDNVERLGLEIGKRNVFGVDIANFVLPVSPARNLSILVETAVKMFLLKSSGSDAALKLIEKHDFMVSGNK